MKPDTLDELTIPQLLELVKEILEQIEYRFMEISE